MVVIQKVFKCQLQTAVFCERCYAGYQAGGIAIGCADVIQYVLCGFFLQLDIAALWDGHEAVFDFTAHAAGCI